MKYSYLVTVAPPINPDHILITTYLDDKIVEREREISGETAKALGESLIKAVALLKVS